MDVKVNVRFFASYKELVKRDRVVFQLEEGSTLRELRRQVFLQYPTLRNIGTSMLVSVNECFVESEEMELQKGDVVAFFPSVSGG
jgi:molybdopterin converting factor subunit 1